MDTADFTRELARTARQVAAERRRPEEAADAIVRFAATRIPGVESVSVTERRAGSRFRTIATAGDVALDGDTLQYELREGPCVAAATTDDLVHVHDVATDDRFPRWGPMAAAELGVTGAISHRVTAADRAFGAVNFYTRDPESLTAEAVDATHLVAHHAVLALTAARLAHDLDASLASRVTIGQAQGILMERFGIDGDHAFGVLRRISQDTNTKLRVVADELVDTRNLPDLDATSE